ncbi:Apolipoprotein N-acyltransferase [Alkalispirochaeta americana]|uniref:Apolipoprotein N-acyltransferase n=1 Tax=Alkalispirochaeta americana TaxID=159291 RepID=A0A1N6W426_9SPIO|nr:apolipoprotein N-acyltransferase [Alkalispirochaeta americana]SIQ84810.1 Apolipoprotein N-acyltransferase [Alkalispirochaeta americana]
MNLLLTLFSAALLTLALPNELFVWGSPFLGLVALIPVFLALYRSSSRNKAALLGVVFGAASTAGANYWLAFFGEFSIWTLGGAMAGYAGYNYLLFTFLFDAIHRGSPRPRSIPGERALAGEGLLPGESWHRPLHLALLWTGYEFLKSVGFLGYPWGLIAYPLSLWTGLAQSAELVGPWGLSFLAAWINAIGAELLLQYRSEGVLVALAKRLRARPFLTRPLDHHVVAAGALVLVLGGFGHYRLATLGPDDHHRSVHILLVQQNIDSWQPGLFSEALLQAQDLTLEALQEHQQTSPEAVDFVLWSETALRRPYRQDDSFYEEVPDQLPFREFLRRLDIPLLTGAPAAAGEGQEPEDYHNSAILISPEGTLLASYGKQQLVPFAESIPFWHVPAVQRFFRTVVGLYGTWVPGGSSAPVKIPAGDTILLAGLPICFEDAFGWVPREMVLEGAEILINLTNNSWSRQDSAQTQHYLAARLRTIELRRPLVRGTNSGLTAVINRRGEMAQAMPMFESNAAVFSVPIPPGEWTLYQAIGDLLGKAAVACAALVLFLREKSGKPERQ